MRISTLSLSGKGFKGHRCKSDMLFYNGRSHEITLTVPLISFIIRIVVLFLVKKDPREELLGEELL